MLIYSSEKEFIGIDEEYLKTFGFQNLAQLQAEHADFADFFIKQPGYVHNFQHVHWIDFIDCAESSEESQVLIKIHAKSFTANLSLSTLYLTQSPASKSYLIKLNNLKQLSGDTGEEFLVNIEEEPPTPPKIQRETYVKPVVAPVLQEQTESSILLDDDLLLDDIPQDTIIPDQPLEIDLEMEEEAVTPIEPQIQTQPQVQAVQETPQEQFIPEEDDYIFNPQVASDELGLPLDLIEEFIEDFIAQAKEFQTELFAALEAGDTQTVASLSHKLKGVAGNLRIENAYDKLCIVNTSKEMDVIKKNLQQFYHIVSQLAGEKAQAITLPPKEKVIEELPLDFDDDDFVLDFKDDIKEAIPMLPVEEPTVIPEKKVPDVLVTYSKTTAAQEIGLDIDTFNELFDDYIQETFSILQTIKDAIAQDDIELCRKKALLLKSMSESMYIKDLASDLSIILTMSDKNSMTIALQNLEAIATKISK